MNDEVKNKFERILFRTSAGIHCLKEVINTTPDSLDKRILETSKKQFEAIWALAEEALNNA